MSDRVDRGEKNDENSTNVDASFSCAELVKNLSHVKN
jgi:hypothetical protein